MYTVFKDMSFRYLQTNTHLLTETLSNLDDPKPTLCMTKRKFIIVLAESAKVLKLIYQEALATSTCSTQWSDVCYAGN